MRRLSLDAGLIALSVLFFLSLTFLVACEGNDGDDDDAIDSLKNDSLTISKKEVYYTNKGRAVYGGGGILPDLEIDPEKYLTSLEINLERKRLFFDFAVKYLIANPNANPGIEITDDITDQFRSFIESKQFAYKTSLEASLDKMKEIIKDEKKDDLFNTTVAEFENRIKKEKEADFIASRDYIKRAIRREIVQQLAGEKGLYEEVILKTDPGIMKAAELLKDNAEYSRILAGGETRGQTPEKDK